MKNELNEPVNMLPFKNDGTVIRHTTLSVSRNIAGFKFVKKASDEQLQQIVNDISDAIYDEFGDGYIYNDMDFPDPFLGDMWVEDQLISDDFEDKECPRAVFTSKIAPIVLVINDINHLKIKIKEKHLGTHQSWSIVSLLDDIIESKVRYSFSPQLGYLTTNLSEAGTGLKFSAILHLPALAMHGRIGDLYDFAVAKDLNVTGCRGSYDPEGDLFRVSNNITIGLSEEDIIRQTKMVIAKIAQFEQQTRKLLVCEQPDTLNDSTMRALGTLRYARMINYIEAANLISKVKLAVLTGLVKGIPLELLDKLLKDTTPAKLNYDHCEMLDYDRQETIRADIIRKALNE
jgi:protein arginine kinase